MNVLVAGHMAQSRLDFEGSQLVCAYFNPFHLLSGFQDPELDEACNFALAIDRLRPAFSPACGHFAGTSGACAATHLS